MSRKEKKSESRQAKSCRTVFYNENLRTALSEYVYISDGEEKDIVPHFTFYGYRYVKISGVTNVSCEDFTGMALYSDYEGTGSIQTGNELVNQLISNVEWGMKDNFLDVPTDCPQRDERMDGQATHRCFRVRHVIWRIPMHFTENICTICIRNS